eukprot:349777-Chlamydomonas_euryale.AAC.7
MHASIFVHMHVAPHACTHLHVCEGGSSGMHTASCRIMRLHAHARSEPRPDDTHVRAHHPRRDASHLALDRRGAKLDALEHLWVAHVDAGVDLVAHKLLRLLHKALHLPVLVHHHHAILAGVLHLGGTRRRHHAQRSPTWPRKRPPKGSREQLKGCH